MKLRNGGIDIFYIDESNDSQTYVLAAVAVPFLRQEGGEWLIVWPDYFERIREWRRRMRRSADISSSTELHGVKLASGRGFYIRNKFNIDKPKANAVYRKILADVDFLPDASVITVAAKRGGRTLYGQSHLEAAMHALFQRMRSQCDARNANGLVFFDQGHSEYRTLYRRAQVYLPTGSGLGGWDGGAVSRNLPLDMFTKDGNEKNSKHCNFTQLADLIAYAAFLKLKSERGALEEWQARYSLGNLYDSPPNRIINHKATTKYPDGIVRLP